MTGPPRAKSGLLAPESRQQPKSAESGLVITLNDGVLSSRRPNGEDALSRPRLFGCTLRQSYVSNAAKNVSTFMTLVKVLSSFPIATDTRFVYY
ncbi:hypothetical protein [Paenibacillus tundrae]|uniref:Uncharacterized protein n=1 Tax=Paenibacillus tundrae TaxID=528187 RepID=A0ABT9W633_9BACL|nr:hypothetical protein [Paenibacillus tundrae]MDQ0168711.1 hypothetical protein [Paenibacillus tundrae]